MDSSASIFIFCLPVVLLTFVEILQNSETGEILTKKLILFFDADSGSFVRSVGNVVFCIIKLGLTVGLGFMLVHSSFNLYGSGNPVFSYATSVIHIVFLISTIAFDLLSNFKKSLSGKYFTRKISYAAGLLLYSLFMQFILPQLLFSIPDSI